MAPVHVETAEEHFQQDIPSDLPVLIIGGGPVGLWQAYCLARHGSNILSNPFHALP